MNKEFLENLVKDVISYPFGKSKDKQQKWENLTKEEQEQWNELAQKRPIQMYILAEHMFIMKTNHGIPEEMSEIFLQKKFNLSNEDMQNLKTSFGHFMEFHKIQSRKSIKRFQA